MVETDISAYKVARVKDSKNAEIEAGLDAIRKLEAYIIELATFSGIKKKQGGETYSIDCKIDTLLSTLKDDTRKNLTLQSIWEK